MNRWVLMFSLNAIGMFMLAASEEGLGELIILMSAAGSVAFDGHYYGKDIK